VSFEPFKNIFTAKGAKGAKEKQGLTAVRADTVSILMNEFVLIFDKIGSRFFCFPLRPLRPLR